jgi:hypothetical protein
MRAPAAASFRLPIPDWGRPGKPATRSRCRARRRGRKGHAMRSTLTARRSSRNWRYCRDRPYPSPRRQLAPDRSMVFWYLTCRKSSPDRQRVNRRAKGTPDRHPKGTPLRRWDRLVQVVHRRDPRASRSALTSDEAARVGGPCAPTWASRGGTAAQTRCLKRQLSLPVSMISQWWVSRSSSAVVILALLKTLGHSAKARLVVRMIELRS